jgi:hypothetical protein
MKNKIHDLYLDYFNNFLSLEGFASYYGFEKSRAARIIEIGQKLNAKKFWRSHVDSK